jgi:histidyl-tRNA synthetase
MLMAGPKGTNDIMPGEIEKWHYLEDIIRIICREYGYKEIRTPVFEHTELFRQGVGDTTDVVEKEMYTFFDKAKRSISLRPEGTACVVRAFVEHKLYAQPQPTKVYYIGPMFRYANVQAGRYRQFHQFGVEVLGSKDPAVDAEVIIMAMEFYRRIGLNNLELHINSVGCSNCRPGHREKLYNYLKPNLEKLCKLCQSRLERNPMRVLDCKEDSCQQQSAGAPTTTDCLCEECTIHFKSASKYLDDIGIKYIINNRLVRGLDYYTNTAFEIITGDIGAQSSIGGGGRYDGLIEKAGGPSTPGIGYALGLERIIATMERQGVQFTDSSKLDVFIATMGDRARQTAFKLLYDIRCAGLSGEMDVMARSLKSQMKFANRFGARFTVIIGDQELEKGLAAVKDMNTGEQCEMPMEGIVKHILNLTRED